MKMRVFLQEIPDMESIDIIGLYRSLSMFNHYFRSLQHASSRFSFGIDFKIMSIPSSVIVWNENTLKASMSWCNWYCGRYIMKMRVFLQEIPDMESIDIIGGTYWKWGFFLRKHTYLPSWINHFENISFPYDFKIMSIPSSVIVWNENTLKASMSWCNI
jgi:hypothetical protein